MIATDGPLVNDHSGVRLMIQTKQTDFFKTIYDPILSKDGQLTNGQRIRVYQKNDAFQRDTFYNCLGDLLDAVLRGRGISNIYFELSTTNGESGKTDDLISRTVLAFDFDKKDNPGLTADDVIYRFKCLNLYYHILIDSGNGYHAYMCIEPTSNHNTVEDVQIELAKRLKADPNATKKTQLMRVPGTLNLKADPLPVNVIQMYPLDTIRRYNIDRLHARFCRSERPQEAERRATLAGSNIPPCIDEAIRNGTQEGQRNNSLMQIVVTLRERGRTLGQVMELAKIWNKASQYDDSLEYRVKYIYENQKSAAMDCQGCKHCSTCYDKIDSDFDYPDQYGVLRMNEKHTQKTTVKALTPTALVLYSVLISHDGLTRPEIDKELTYRGKIAFSDRTIREALKNLEENKLIEIKKLDRFNLYTSRRVLSKPGLTFYLSYAASIAVIKQEITPAEFRLYIYMRYLHNKIQREDPGALKGNLFQYNQRKLADDLGITQQRVSQMIQKLLDERLLSEWYRKPSRFNGFDYIVYRLMF